MHERTAKSEKAPAQLRSLSLKACEREGLLERVLHRLERAAQVGADVLHDGDDGNGDAGGDEAIFDGGGARLVLHETRNEGLHSWLLRSTRGCLSLIRWVVVSRPIRTVRQHIQDLLQQS